MMEEYEIEADKVEQQFRRGIITDGERRQQEVRHLDRCHRRGASRDGTRVSRQWQFNPVEMMVGSGARGNMDAGASDRRYAGPGSQPSW